MAPSADAEPAAAPVVVDFGSGLSAAVASAVAEPVYTWEDIKSIAKEQVDGGQVQPWVRNSKALNYLRYLGEDPAGVLRLGYDPPDVPLDSLVQIEEAGREEVGTDFSFGAPSAPSSTVQWSAAQFLSAMWADTVEAMGLAAHGVRRLQMVPFDEMDDLRMLAARRCQKPFASRVEPRVWGFLVTRGDGVQYRFHPRFDIKKMDPQKWEGTPMAIVGKE